MRDLFRRLAALVGQSCALLVRDPGGSLSLGVVLLLLWQYYGYPMTYRLWLDDLIGPWRYRAIASSLYWFGTNVVMLFCTPLLVARLVWRRSARELGLGLGDWRLGLAATGVIYAVMLPLVILVAPWADFRATYPLDPCALGSHEFFWVYEVGYAGFFVGWEFFFRGFLLFSLEPSLGPVAVVVQMVPFALLHVGKPIAETLGSVAAGIFLGVLAWRTRSIWYGVAIHAAVALTMDIVVYLRWGLSG